MPKPTFADIVSAFGAEAKAKLNNPAASGAPEALRALITDLLTWTPEPPASARALAEASARLCRLLREEVL